jgi:hypothetical protein
VPAAEGSVPSRIRAMRDLQLKAGRTVTDPDLLAFPRSGGVPIAIEAKAAGDKLHPDGAQENGLLLLEAIGFKVEVWWICDESSRFLRPSLPRPCVAPIGIDEDVRVRVREGMNWNAARDAALATVKRRVRRTKTIR